MAGTANDDWDAACVEWIHTTLLHQDAPTSRELRTWLVEHLDDLDFALEERDPSDHEPGIAASRAIVAYSYDNRADHMLRRELVMLSFSRVLQRRTSIMLVPISTQGARSRRLRHRVGQRS
jgi:hypothetical protein